MSLACIIIFLRKLVPKQNDAKYSELGVGMNNFRLVPSLFRSISAPRNIVTSAGAQNHEEDAAEHPLGGLRPRRSNYVPLC